MVDLGKDSRLAEATSQPRSELQLSGKKTKQNPVELGTNSSLHHIGMQDIHSFNRECPTSKNDHCEISLTQEATKCEILLTAENSKCKKSLTSKKAKDLTQAEINQLFPPIENHKNTWDILIKAQNRAIDLYDPEKNLTLQKHNFIYHLTKDENGKYIVKTRLARSTRRRDEIRLLRFIFKTLNLVEMICGRYDGLMYFHGFGLSHLADGADISIYSANEIMQSWREAGYVMPLPSIKHIPQLGFRTISSEYQFDEKIFALVGLDQELKIEREKALKHHHKKMKAVSDKRKRAELFKPLSTEQRFSIIVKGNTVRKIIHNEPKAFGSIVQNILPSVTLQSPARPGLALNRVIVDQNKKQKPIENEASVLRKAEFYKRTHQLAQELSKKYNIPLKEAFERAKQSTLPILEKNTS